MASPSGRRATLLGFSKRVARRPRGEKGGTSMARQAKGGTLMGLRRHELDVPPFCPYGRRATLLGIFANSATPLTCLPFFRTARRATLLEKRVARRCRGRQKSKRLARRACCRRGRRATFLEKSQKGGTSSWLWIRPTCNHFHRWPKRVARRDDGFPGPPAPHTNQQSTSVTCSTCLPFAANSTPATATDTPH